MSKVFKEIAAMSDRDLAKLLLGGFSKYDRLTLSRELARRVVEATDRCDAQFRHGVNMTRGEDKRLSGSTYACLQFEATHLGMEIYVNPTTSQLCKLPAGPGYYVEIGVDREHAVHVAPTLVAAVEALEAQNRDLDEP